MCFIKSILTDVYVDIVLILALEEHFRQQFDDDTRRLSQSSSSPVFQPSKPSLSQYVQKHLPEFGFADLELKVDSDAGSSESLCSSGETSAQNDSSSSASFKITFQLGADDLKELPDTNNKFWYDNEDSLTVGQSDVDYLSTASLQQERSLSMIELQGVSSSHQLRVS